MVIKQQFDVYITLTVIIINCHQGDYISFLLPLLSLVVYKRDGQGQIVTFGLAQRVFLSFGLNMYMSMLC